MVLLDELILRAVHVQSEHAAAVETVELLVPRTQLPKGFGPGALEVDGVCKRNLLL
jgi:hypothetical protein